MYDSLSKYFSAVVVDKDRSEFNLSGSCGSQQPNADGPTIGDCRVDIVSQGIVLIIHLPVPADIIRTVD